MKPILNDAGGHPLTPPLPPLEPGDRLTRDEFERRYQAMPHLTKAELIEGVVYMPSPVRVYRHGQPHFDLITWMGVYRASTPGLLGGDNTTARLDLDNEPQPDAMLFVKPEHGGQVSIGDDDYIEGAPELVAEISSSSVSFDLHTKLNVYRRCGVREYVVWRVLDRAIDWFVLEGGAYVPLAAAEGVFKSRVFPGLWLDAQALLADDLPRVMSALQQGIATPEHAAFVQQLANNKR